MKFNSKFFWYSLIAASVIVLILKFIPPVLGVSFELAFELGTLFLSALAFPAIVMACIVLKDISEIKKEINDEIVIVNSMNSLRAKHEQDFYKKYTGDYKPIIKECIHILKNISLNKSQEENYEKEFEENMLECYNFVREAKTVRNFVKKISVDKLSEDNKKEYEGTTMSESNLDTLIGILKNYDRKIEEFTKDDIHKLSDLLKEFKIVADYEVTRIDNHIQGYYVSDKPNSHKEEVDFFE